MANQITPQIRYELIAQLRDTSLSPEDKQKAIDALIKLYEIDEANSLKMLEIENNRLEIENNRLEAEDAHRTKRLELALNTAQWGVRWLLLATLLVLAGMFPQAAQAIIEMILRLLPILGWVAAAWVALGK